MRVQWLIEESPQSDTSSSDIKLPLRHEIEQNQSPITTNQPQVHIALPTLSLSNGIFVAANTSSPEPQFNLLTYIKPAHKVHFNINYTPWRHTHTHTRTLNHLPSITLYHKSGVKHESTSIFCGIKFFT